MPSIAKVGFLSPLPRLDRLFDYQIPIELHDLVRPGSQVLVNFGSSKKPIEGIIFRVSNESAYEGKLSTILQVSNPNTGLGEVELTLVLELSRRNVATIGEILKSVLPASKPSRSSKIQDKPDRKLPQLTHENFLNGIPVSEFVSKPGRFTQISAPGEVQLRVEDKRVSLPSGLAFFVEIAARNLEVDRSTLLLTPDFREHTILCEALLKLGYGDWLADLSPEQTKSKRYESQVRAFTSPSIVVGNRSAAAAPIFQLGTICLWDESDDSYTDQSAPYLNAREVVLLRQQLSSCALLFSAPTRSPQIQRLLELGFLQDISVDFPKPIISFSAPGFRVDSHAHKAIQVGLKEGSVLVQVASRGDSASIACSNCNQPARCHICHGPLMLDDSKHLRCKWCNAYLSSIHCACGGNDYKLGRAGSTRTVAEFGKSFPNAPIIEATSEQRFVRLPRKNQLIVATPGAEPYIDGGYSSVILLDAQALLARQHLSAAEAAIRQWSNAVSKLSKTGKAVLVGVSGKLAQDFSLWDQGEVARIEWNNRKELSLPPAVRMGSAESTQEMLVQLAEALGKLESVEIIGPAPIAKSNTEWKLLFKYPYTKLFDVVEAIKAFQLRAGSIAVPSKSGRNSRSLKVHVSDPEVI